MAQTHPSDVEGINALVPQAISLARKLQAEVQALSATLYVEVEYADGSKGSGTVTGVFPFQTEGPGGAPLVMARITPNQPAAEEPPQPPPTIDAGGVQPTETVEAAVDHSPESVGSVPA